MKIFDYDIYVLGNIGCTRWIIRNQWSKFSSGGFKIIELGRSEHRDRKEFMFTLLGIQLVLFIN